MIGYGKHYLSRKRHSEWSEESRALENEILHPETNVGIQDDNYRCHMYEDIKPGMTVRVHEKIKDKTDKGEKERVQIFEGMVIARHGRNQSQATLTVRKIGANGVGVEKIYPLNAPAIAKIEPVSQAQVRRAKLYFLRDYKKKLKEVPVKI